MSRHVWTFADADISIYREDNNGNLIDLSGSPPAPVPVLEYCYLEGANLKADAALSRRAITGRGRKKIVRQSGYENIVLEVNHLFFKKSDELDLVNIFNSGQQLRIAFNFFDISYSDIPPEENDPFILSFARAEHFSVVGRDDQNCVASATFLAELFL